MPILLLLHAPIATCKNECYKRHSHLPSTFTHYLALQNTCIMDFILKLFANFESHNNIFNSTTKALTTTQPFSQTLTMMGLLKLVVLNSMWVIFAYFLLLQTLIPLIPTELSIQTSLQNFELVYNSQMVKSQMVEFQDIVKNVLPKQPCVKF